MCPGHILLFGHVNILILSLLSKSLPMKGREARPGRERRTINELTRNVLLSMGAVLWDVRRTLARVLLLARMYGDKRAAPDRTECVARVWFCWVGPCLLPEGGLCWRVLEA